MIDDKILLHKELSGRFKSEILIHSDSLRTILVFGIFLPEAKKAAPGRKESKHTLGVNSGSKKTLPL
jgi:hypothetical protein